MRRPQTRVVVPPKGASYAFSPWEPPNTARQRAVYEGFVLKGLLFFGGILGGGESQPITATAAVKRAHNARAAHILLQTGRKGCIIADDSMVTTDSSYPRSWSLRYRAVHPICLLYLCSAYVP